MKTSTVDFVLWTIAIIMAGAILGAGIAMAAIIFSLVLAGML